MSGSRSAMACVRDFLQRGRGHSNYEDKIKKAGEMDCHLIEQQNLLDRLSSELTRMGRLLDMRGMHSSQQVYHAWLEIIDAVSRYCEKRNQIHLKWQELTTNMEPEKVRTWGERHRRSQKQLITYEDQVLDFIAVAYRGRVMGYDQYEEIRAKAYHQLSRHGRASYILRYIPQSEYTGC